MGRVAPGDEKAIEALGLALSGDPDIDVQSAAAAAGLGWMGAAAAAPVLIRALNDRDGAVRVHVIMALGRIGPADGSIATVLKTIAAMEWAVGGRQFELLLGCQVAVRASNRP